MLSEYSLNLLKISNLAFVDLLYLVLVCIDGCGSCAYVHRCEHVHAYICGYEDAHTYVCLYEHVHHINMGMSVLTHMFVDMSMSMQMCVCV